MPPTTDSNSTNTTAKKILITCLLVVVIIIVVGAVLTYFKKDRSVPQTTHKGEVLDTVTYSKNQNTLDKAGTLMTSGDFAEAAKIFTEVINENNVNQTLTSEQLYTARRSLLAKYRATGVPRDSLAAVEEIKKTVFDESMPMIKRAESLSTLANSVCWFGRDPEVLAAIFNEPEFKAAWKGDPTLANRDLLLLSYEKYTPTAKTASSLAYWYADQVVLNDLIKKELDTETRTKYVSEAKRYIKEANELSLKEYELSKQKYKLSARYLGYLYRNAFAIGALASVGELTKNDYQAAYALFHAEAEKSTSAVALQYTPFAYVLEAQFEKNFGGSSTIITSNLKKALIAIDSDPNPQSNEITDFIRDKALDIEGRYSWHAIQQMRKEFKEFGIFVETVELAAK